jgi:hypothetical protein
MSASAKAAESTFDRSVTGKNNAALDADNEPIFETQPNQNLWLLEAALIKPMYRTPHEFGGYVRQPTRLP